MHTVGIITLQYCFQTGNALIDIMPNTCPQIKVDAPVYPKLATRWQDNIKV